MQEIKDAKDILAIGGYYDREDLVITRGIGEGSQTIVLTPGEIIRLVTHIFGNSIVFVGAQSSKDLDFKDQDAREAETVRDRASKVLVDDEFRKVITSWTGTTLFIIRVWKKRAGHHADNSAVALFPEELDELCDFIKANKEKP